MTTSPDQVSTVSCPACHSEVPAAVYCGCCGAVLNGPPGYWRNLLRPGAFVAAPRERIIVPLVASTLFPHLATRSRNPFRIGLLLLVLSLVGFAKQIGRAHV